jgi:YidC/Oxa1 family membrane protein insertase
VLRPNSPVTLTYDNGQGLTFTRLIAVDDQAMFTVTDSVKNNGTAAFQLAPYATVQRQGITDHLGKTQIVHEGAIGVLGAGKDHELKLSKYQKWKKDKPLETFDSVGGWAGITDKYWLAALIPGQDQTIKAQYRVTQASGTDIYDVLEIFYKLVGNFGLAIMALTVLLKLILYPMADKSYESMAKIKKISPEVEKLKAKHKDDPAKQQQEMMALYAKEKINPMMGCLPMLVQIPVFYSLYKVLTVTIEMRHAPFFGWIHDLSSRDPTTIFNLFGLIPWDPAHAPLIGAFLSTTLHIGVWPLLYGFTMWLTTAMNPPAGDPMQQRIFQLFPIVFTFTLSQFAVGLVIYWCWSNILTIIQQYIIMRRYKVENPIDKIIARIQGKPANAT